MFGVSHVACGSENLTEFNTNSGTLNFQDASLDILVHILLLCESPLFGTILDD